MSFHVGAAARRWCRAALTALLLVGGSRGAWAQSGECDGVIGERELRALAFQGNRSFSSSDLASRVATTPSSWAQRKLHALGTRRCLDSDVLRLDVGRLRVFYQRHGYYAAAVDTAVTTNDDGSVRVAFLITEGDPVVIDSLRIAGLDSVTAPLANTERLELRKGAVFDRTQLQAAIDSIKTRLRNNGYPRADVAASYTVDTVAHHAVVGLDVIPASRARFGEVRVYNSPVAGGEPHIGAATVQRLSSLRTGDLYRERDLADAQRGLYQTDLFQRVEVRVAPDSLQPKGDTLVAIEVLLRENYLRQVDTEIGWAVLDCFKERTTYTDKNFLGEARRLELTAQVSKVGYGTPTRIANGDLCAYAIRADTFSAQLNYFTAASFRLPSIFGFRTSPTFSLYSERRGEYQAYLRTTVVGGDASVTKDIGYGLPLRLGYSLEYGRTDAPPALLCAIFSRCDAESRAAITGKNRPLAVASAHLERVRTDNALNPQSGTVLRWDVRTSQRAIGSDPELQFVKGLSDASFYKALTRGVTFAARLRLGTVLGRTLSFGDTAGFIPPEERLYAGGATSVRGFQQNALGDLIYIADAAPQTIKGNGDTVYFAMSSNPDSQAVRQPVPQGGTALIVANFELRARSWFFSDLLQYTFFVDAGDVWQRGQPSTSSQHTASSLFLNSLKWTPGIGIRVFTPVGPFQANVGYNPYPQPLGAVYFDVAPVGGVAPLYCVTPGNRIPAVPNPINGVPEQLTGSAYQCPTTFQPPQNNSFFKRLTFTFSIGPDF
jgi:outer membrane protein insertion porin family/translocation and assembly module TamA